MATVCVQIIEDAARDGAADSRADSDCASNGKLVRVYSREYNYQRSFWRRSCIARPMPGGKRVYLVLLQFALLEIVSYTTELYLANRWEPYLTLRKWKDNTKPVQLPLPSLFLLLRSLYFFFCLPMGFLADRYFGRMKVMIFSWFLLFVVQCVFTMHVALVESYSTQYLSDEGYVIITALLCAVLAVGLAGVHVNLIPYGVDQLPKAFADELSSYFHWYYWCQYIGIFFVNTFSTILLGLVNAGYMLLVSTVSCTIALVINLSGRGWFSKAGTIGNPISLILRVLRYAATAKKPEERSAFSYDGRPEPSRLDLVKCTHFGCINDEKVEDVKIFFRILGILLSLIGFFCVSVLLYSVYIVQVAHLKLPRESFLTKTSSYQCDKVNQTFNKDIEVCELYASPQLMLAVTAVTLLILIPILDRIFYPISCCQWGATMFNRITVGMCFSMLSIVCALALEVWRHGEFSDDVTVVNKVRVPDYYGYNRNLSDSSNQSLQTVYYVASNISAYTIVPQFIFHGVAEAFSKPAIVEFIYAQSPGYMKGLLLGCLFFTKGLAAVLGAVLLVVLSKFNSHIFRTFGVCHSSLCDCDDQTNGFAIGMYTTVTAISLASFVWFRCAVRNFVRRKREKDLKYFTM